MNADGSNSTLVLASQFNQYEGIEKVAWSPDNTHLVFSALNGGFYNVFSVKVDGTELTQLTTDNNSHDPAWALNSGYTIPATLTPTPTVVATPTPFVCDYNVPPSVVTFITNLNQANGAGVPQTLCLTTNATYTLETSNTYFFGPTGLTPITGDITIIGNGATIQRNSTSSNHFRLCGHRQCGRHGQPG